MELALIGGSVLFFRQFLEAPKEKISENDLDAQGFDAPGDFLMKELRRGGVIAGKHNSVSARVPFNTDKPPFDIWRANGDEAKWNPTEELWGHHANAAEHHRADYEEANRAGKEYFLNKRGGAIPLTFSRELHNPADPSMSTGLMNYAWLPPNPTDADFVRAGQLAHNVPRHPNQFTPDATYFTAPGLSWRYGNR